jgi:hypothetical protein
MKGQWESLCNDLNGLPSIKWVGGFWDAEIGSHVLDSADPKATGFQTSRIMNEAIHALSRPELPGQEWRGMFAGLIMSSNAHLTHTKPKRLPKQKDANDACPIIGQLHVRLCELEEEIGDEWSVIIDDLHHYHVYGHPRGASPLSILHVLFKAVSECPSREETGSLAIPLMFMVLDDETKKTIDRNWMPLFEPEAAGGNEEGLQEAIREGEGSGSDDDRMLISDEEAEAGENDRAGGAGESEES